MKILMTADPIGGVWQYALELCRALRPHGAEVMLATLGRELSPQQRTDAAALPYVELRESRYRLEWMESPWDSLADAGEWLLSLAHEMNPDVVHLNHLVHAHLEWNAPTLVVGHSCVLSWWEAVHGGTPPSTWTRYRETVTASLQSAELVIAPSCAMLEALSRHYGPFAQSFVIANGRDPGSFSTSPKQPLILSAGRLWDEAKNIGALCEVAAAVRWPICVAGETFSPDGSKNHVHGVRVLGPLSPPILSDWYSISSIYALPARYEPFGLTALEAAHSGCALVLGDIDSLREIWGDAASYVPPDDRDALRDTLNDLIRHPVQRRRLANLARDRARVFSPAAMAHAYRAAYRSITGIKELTECASSSSTIH